MKVEIVAIQVVPMIHLFIKKVFGSKTKTFKRTKAGYFVGAHLVNTPFDE